MAKEKFKGKTNDLSQLETLLQQTEAENIAEAQNAASVSVQEAPTASDEAAENVQQPQNVADNEINPIDERPTDGKGLYEILLHNRSALASFTTFELMEVANYMAKEHLTSYKGTKTKQEKTAVEHARTVRKLVDHALEDKSAELLTPPYKDILHLDLRNRENCAVLYSICQKGRNEENSDFDDNTKQLIAEINHRRQRQGFGNVENQWSYMDDMKEERKPYKQWLFDELYDTKPQENIERFQEFADSMGKAEIKDIVQNIATYMESHKGDENFAQMQSVIPILLQQNLEMRQKNRSERTAEPMTAAENVVASAEGVEAQAAEVGVAAEGEEAQAAEAGVAVEGEEAQAAEVGVAAEGEEAQAAEVGVAAEGEEYTIEEFFALPNEERHELISQMTAQDLLEWYDVLNRNLYSDLEYIPTAEQKISFYKMALPHVVELSGQVHEKTADKEELETTIKLLSAYSVDFYGVEVNPLQSNEAARFAIQFQAKKNALATRFPEVESFQANDLNNDDKISQGDDAVDEGDDATDSEANEIMNQLIDFAEIDWDKETYYDYKDIPWTDAENAQREQAYNFFEHVQIQYDNEWHQDLLTRGAIEQNSGPFSKNRAYTVKNMQRDVFRLAREAAVQEIIEQKGSNITIDDFDDPQFIRQIRQAVLDQRDAICKSILETQISKDLVHLSKEEAHEKAQAQYAKVSANRDSDAKLSRIDKIAQKLGLADNGTILLQDSSILSAIAAKSTLLKENATNLITKFKENTVAGKLLVKSQERIKNFETKLAKEHPYLNVVYSSAKMITAGAVIGALGSPVATTAWIAYNVAKADKAFYNEYKKHCQQTGEKGFWKYAAKNPWRTTLTAASNVGIALGLVDGSAGGAVRMISGGAGAISAAAKDFMQGNWKMGITKMVTFAAGYGAGSLAHGHTNETNVQEDNTGAASNTTLNENIHNVSQEVYDKTVNDINQYAQNMKLNIELPESIPPQAEDVPAEEFTTTVKTVAGASNDVITDDEIARVKANVKFTVPTIDGQDALDDAEISEIPDNSSNQPLGSEQYVEQPPHAPALNEGDKITLIGGDPLNVDNHDSLVQVKVEQSDNGVVETEIGKDGKIAVQRAIMEENGVKHCVITQNGETRYMTPEEENHFIRVLSHNSTIGRADAGTAELLAEIHNMPAVQDVERAEFVVAHAANVESAQETVALQQNSLPQENIGVQPDEMAHRPHLERQSENVVQINMPEQPQSEHMEQARPAMAQPDEITQQFGVEKQSENVAQINMPEQPQSEPVVQPVVTDQEPVYYTEQEPVVVQQEPVVADAEVIHSHSEESFAMAENGQISMQADGKSFRVVGGEGHAVWEKQTDDGRWEVMKPREVDELYGKIAPQLYENEDKYIALVNAKLWHDTEVVNYNSSVAEQAVQSSSDEIQKGQEQERQAAEAQQQARAELAKTGARGAKLANAIYGSTTTSAETVSQDNVGHSNDQQAGTISDTVVSTQEAMKINQSLGIENGQMRAHDGKIVTMSNNGFSICSDNGSIAMVEKNGQIYGYNIDANGHQSLMKPSEISQQFKASLPHLKGTAYEHSDFAKVAGRHFSIPQQQATRI